MSRQKALHEKQGFWNLLSSSRKQKCFFWDICSKNAAAYGAFCRVERCLGIYRCPRAWHLKGSSLSFSLDTQPWVLILCCLQTQGNGSRDLRRLISVAVRGNFDAGNGYDMTETEVKLLRLRRGRLHRIGRAIGADGYCKGAHEYFFVYE